MKLACVLVGGLCFGFGLAWSGMARPEVVLSFLYLEDFGLLLVMGAAVAVTAAAFRFGPRVFARPLVVGAAFERHRARMRPRTVGGAVLFGLGWGISGMCPGSALASIGLGNAPILVGVAGMFVGAWLEGRFFGESGTPRLPRRDADSSPRPEDVRVTPPA